MEPRGFEVVALSAFPLFHRDLTTKIFLQIKGLFSHSDTHPFLCSLPFLVSHPCTRFATLNPASCVPSGPTALDIRQGADGGELLTYCCLTFCALFGEGFDGFFLVCMRKALEIYLVDNFGFSSQMDFDAVGSEKFPNMLCVLPLGTNS